MNIPYTLYKQPDLSASTLIVGWQDDAGGLGSTAVSHLMNHLDFLPLGEIEPVEFFPLNGITVSGNVARFPESKLFYHPGKELVLLLSSAPVRQWYRFLNAVTDIALVCHVREIYTMGGMITLSAHSAPRNIISVVNNPDMKATIAEHVKVTEMEFDSPQGHRPTINSFLLWVAEKRGIPAAALWVTMPFYMVPLGDNEAYQQVLTFFNRKYKLGLDFSDLENKTAEKYQKITNARMEFPDLDSCLTKLENHVPLTGEENEKLVAGILQAFNN